MPFVFESWMTDPDNRGAHFIEAIARVRPGVDVEAANRDMATVGARLKAEYPKSNAVYGGMAQSLQKTLIGDVRNVLLTMFGAVVFVLLIACANVANLLLVRAASARTGRIAVRTALGAGRGRIIRQLVTESVMLSGLGALIGGVRSREWASRRDRRVWPEGSSAHGIHRRGRTRPRLLRPSLALVTGIAFGLVPALHAAKTELGQMLKESACAARADAAARSERETCSSSARWRWRSFCSSAPAC